MKMIIQIKYTQEGEEEDLRKNSWIKCGIHKKKCVWVKERKINSYYLLSTFYGGVSLSFFLSRFVCLVCRRHKCMLTQGTRFSGGTRCYWKWNKQTRTTWTQRSERDGWRKKKRWKKLKWNKIFTIDASEQKILSDFFNWLNIDSRNLQVFYLWNFLVYFLKSF